MKIVLVRLPFYALFGLRVPKMNTYPLNLLYLATGLHQQSAHQVSLIDGDCLSAADPPAAAATDSDPAPAMGRRTERMAAIVADPRHPVWIELEHRILAEDPDVVGLTCNSVNLAGARIMAQRIKAAGLRVILGGSHPTVLPAQSLIYTGADMAVVGEGEHVLPKVLDTLGANGDLNRVPSLVWRQNGRIRANPRAGRISAIDRLPTPDRGLIDRGAYFGDVILTGRGCPHDCLYCASKTVWGRRLIQRSVPAIIRELHELDPGHNVDGTSRPGNGVVKILDDTFTMHPPRTHALLDAIIAQGLNRLEFTCGVRADTIDRALARKMRLAGIQRVTLGLESGSPAILRLIQKGHTLQAATNALGLLREAGIHTHAFFMIGFPTETPRDIVITKQFIERSQPDRIEINMVTPFPGTPLFDRLIDEDPLKIRWQRWFHQGAPTHADKLEYDLAAEFDGFVEFAEQFNQR